MIGACVLLMWFSGRKNKAAKAEVDNFRSNLTPGDEIMTGSGLLGTIVEVDKATNSAVIDSEGTKSRWVLEALTKPRAVQLPEVEGEVKDEVENKIESDAKNEAESNE
jgi:preprotein translocase subunit YajC